MYSSENQTISRNFCFRRYQPENYEDDVEDEDVDGYNVVDESKEWQCTFCTYLNSLEVEVCDMCAKSRRSVLSQHSSHPEDEEEFVRWDRLLYRYISTWFKCKKIGNYFSK